MGTTAEMVRSGRRSSWETDPNAPHPAHLPNHFTVRNPHSPHTCSSRSAALPTPTSLGSDPAKGV